MNKIFLARMSRILGVVAGLFLCIVFLAWIGNAQDRANEPNTLSVPAHDQDWSVGNATAPVTIVEYSDFQCPACRSYAPAMKQLHATYGDNLRIIYRNFPLTSIHANAHLAAQAAEAAGKQGKFFLMHDKLFEEQNSWNDLENPTGTFIQYASALGLNIEQFTTDLESTEVKQAIADDIASGTRSNVNSTPTFFVNGTELTIQTNALDALTNAIDTAQKQAAL